MPEQQVISSKGCTIDRPVMVRSLRRRLWKAIQEEDVETAMRTYTVTLSEYGKWIREEADEEELLQKVAEQRKSQALKVRVLSALFELNNFYLLTIAPRNDTKLVQRLFDD